MATSAHQELRVLIIIISYCMSILLWLRLFFPEAKKAAAGFAPANSGFADRRLSYLAIPPRRLVCQSQPRAYIIGAGQAGDGI
jgi:hypothetical protein